MGAPRQSMSQHLVTVLPEVLVGVQAMTLNTDHAFSRHSHDSFGLGLMIAGGQRSWSGRGWIEAGAGDCITVNPGEMHDGAPLAGPRAWRMTYLSPALVASITAELGIDAPAIGAPAIRDGPLCQAFEQFFNRVEQAVRQSGGADVAALALEESLLTLVGGLFRHHGARAVAVERGAPAVRQARQRLDDAPEQAVTLAALADLAGVSRFQLLRGFAREVGLTPHAYQVQRRTLLAQRLLREGQAPADVAASAGFADQSHLTRVFRRQFGLTPARFRAAFHAGPLLAGPRLQSRSRPGGRSS